MNRNKVFGCLLSWIIAFVVVHYTKEIAPGIIIGFWGCYYVMDAVE